jgi:hypothetical protein
MAHDGCRIDAVMVRARATMGGRVGLQLCMIPRGAAWPEAAITVEELEARFAALPEGTIADGEEVRLEHMRVVHRQRLGRLIHFVGMRSASGAEIEAILRQGRLESSHARLGDCCALGDAVSVCGLVERSKGRLSVLCRRLSVDEEHGQVFGAHTLFRDDGAKGLPAGLHSASVVAQVVASHASRLSEYLEAAHGVRTLATVAPYAGPRVKPKPAAAITAPPDDGATAGHEQADTQSSGEQRAKRKGKGNGEKPAKQGGSRDERALLLAAPDPATLATTVLADPTVARFVQRWYTIDGDAYGTLASATAAACARVRSVLGSTSSAADVRVQAFPNELEAPLVRALGESGAAQPHPRSESLVSLVHVYGAYRVGVSAGAAAFSVSSTPAGDKSVCRAFYKLREVASRCALALDVPHAVDIGASPGGWTSCLAQSGCARVTAVDPGELVLPEAVVSSGAVEHLRMRFEDALPLMADRGDALDLVVCDINAPPKAVVGMVRMARPMLAPACPLVLTFKNPYPSKAEWAGALDAALDELRELADDVSVLHLLANTSKETTVVGKMRHVQKVEPCR